MEIGDRKQTQKISEIKDKKIINCLYSYFKNAPKKLKIVCDWDEVIQPLEPKVYYELSEQEGAYYDAPWWMPNGIQFEAFFSNFWLNPPIYYSRYGSHSIYKETSMIKSCLAKPSEQGVTFGLGPRSIKEKIDKIKSEPDFYQKSPFLTIAKELLMLIKADKVEQLIFLTAYDKRKFPEGDFRKLKIFQETFGKFSNCFLQLIGFESEGQGINKADWIKKNALDFDIVIDDNPLICKSIIESCSSETRKIKSVCAPCYHSIMEKHHSKVMLIKTSISNLEKKDFKSKKS